MSAFNMSRGNEVCDINSHTLFGEASVCNFLLWNLQHVPTKLISCVPLAGWDVLDLATRLMWTHDLIYGGGQCVSEGRKICRGAVRRPAAVIQETGWCHFDREQRGPCWCQWGARHSDKLCSSSLSLCYSPSLSVALPHNLLLSQSCLVHLSH